MRKLKLASFTLLLMAGAFDAVAAPNCPNRPAGATTLLDCAFNSTNCSGEIGGPLWELYPGAASITQPGGNPASSPNADTSMLPAFSSVGGQQTIWPNPGNQQPLTNFYQCLIFQMGPGFIGQQTANKLFFMHTKDWPYNRYTNNGFFGLQGNGYPPSNFYLYFGHNTGAHDGLPGLDNSHVCAQDSGLVCGPNVTTTLMTPGNWYTLEVYMVSGTCITCRNTVIKWWVNGALNGNYTNLNYTDGVINQWQLNHTWDGGSAVQCGPPTNPANTIGRDCRVDQKYHFDHVVLASVGGVSPGQGGGGTIAPPPPPPLAPNKPTNLRVQ